MTIKINMTHSSCQLRPLLTNQVNFLFMFTINTILFNYIKETNKQRKLAEVGFKPMNSGYKCSALPSDPFKPVHLLWVLVGSHIT